MNIAPEVARALADNKPVVALESTIISHGLPRPRNREAALEFEQILRDKGVVPATIAVIDGIPTVGLDAEGRLTLIDEVITPDSSRFWPADTWRPGASPPSFDKQFVRDHLETLDWDKTAPGPALPPEIIDKTSAKYMEALRRLTGPTLGSSARTQPASGPG